MTTNPDDKNKAADSAAPGDAATEASGDTATEAPEGAAPETATEAAPGAAPEAAPEGATAAWPTPGEGDGHAYGFPATEDDDGAAPVPAPAASSGILSTETFSIAGVLAVLGSLIGTRMVEMLASVTAASQEGMIKAIVIGDGVFALVGVVLAIGGLTASRPHTRPWARWLSAAVLLIGILLAAGAVGTYFMVPPPAPPQPMVPGM